jgi:hypothetical protein
MALARWDEILQRVLNNLQDPSGAIFNKGRVLKELDQVQTNIAQDALAIQATTSIDTVAAQTNYVIASSIFRIKQLFRPTAWTLPLEIITDTAQFERILASEYSSSSQPLFVAVWAGELMFYPAPVDIQTVIVLSYNNPTITPAEGLDPELDGVWDDALVLSCTARLLATKDQAASRAWEARYDAEFKKHANTEMKGKILASHTVDHSSKRLGF